MPTHFKALEPVATREKVMAFTEEALLITGISVGSLIGGAIMVKDRLMGMEAPGPLLHGAYSAVAIGLVVGKITPIAINYAFNRSRLSQNVAPLANHLEKAITPHIHRESRLAGMAAGIAMSVTMASILNLEPFDKVIPDLRQTFVTEASAASLTPAPTVADNKEYDVVYPTGFGTVAIPPIKVPVFDKE